MNNGGCDQNALCSHDKNTFAVVCTCKTGYTNVGTADAVKCEGKFDSPRSMLHTLTPFHIDSCKVNNGECDKNAKCSHDQATFAVVCTCKTGYTNVGTDGKVKCEGNILFNIKSIHPVLLQIAVMLIMVAVIRMQPVHMTRIRSLWFAYVRLDIRMLEPVALSSVMVSFLKDLFALNYAFNSR